MTASKTARFLRKFIRQAAFPAILLLTCLGRLSAQGVTAMVTGTVADSTSAVDPGAVVRIEGRNFMVEAPETVKVIAWRDKPVGRVLTPKRTGDRVDTWNVVEIS